MIDAKTANEATIKSVEDLAKGMDEEGLDTGGLHFDLYAVARDARTLSALLKGEHETHVVVPDVVLWAAWKELNDIRARSGVPLDFDGKPQSISEEYFSKLVDDLHDALGDKAQPWAPTNMIAAAQKFGE